VQFLKKNFFREKVIFVCILHKSSDVCLACGREGGVLKRETLARASWKIERLSST
jgi:hypothetical protein